MVGGAEGGGDRALLAAYRATRWEVRLEEQTLELRVGRPAPLPPALRPAAVLTAWNPASELRSPARNRAAQRRLRAELDGLGLALLPARARGTGPDADLWDEPGFLACAAPLAAVTDLAGRYGQNAILWIGDRGVPELRASRPGFCGRRPGDPL